MILKKISKRKLFLFLGDILIISLSMNLAFIIRLKKSIISYLGLYEATMTILFILPIYLISFYIFDLYNIKEKFKSIRFLTAEIGSLILVFLISIVFFYVFPFMVGRGVFLISLILTGIFIPAWRVSHYFLFKLAVPQRNVLIVGGGKPAEVIYSLINKNPEYKVSGFIGDVSKEKGLSKIIFLGNFLSLEEVLNDYKIDDIIVTIDLARKKQLNRALVNCKLKGITISDMPTFYEYLMDKLPIDYIKERWFLYSDGFDKLGNKIYTRSKRAIDLFISFIILIICFPIGLIISLAIKLSSKGPIFLIQKRVGENNKPYNLFKFRTMVADAEKGEPRWATENDLRVTSIGKILRKIRWDELPQLINVIKGEMSFIGPRPEREYFVKELMGKIPFYSFRFSVKPGITGWAQVNYKYGASVEDALEKLRYDLYYVKNMSLFLDFRILLKTIRTVMFGMGR